MLSKPRLVAALHELGPAPSMIAMRLKVTVPAVRQAIADDAALRTIYIARESEILAAIRMFGIDVRGITGYLNITRSQFSAVVQDNPRIKLAYEDARMEIIDVAERELMSALSRGKEWAVKMVLESEMGSTRGYGQRREVNVHLEASRLGQDATALRDRLVAAIIEQANTEDDRFREALLIEGEGYAVDQLRDEQAQVDLAGGEIG